MHIQKKLQLELQYFPYKNNFYFKSGGTEALIELQTKWVEGKLRE